MKMTLTAAALAAATALAMPAHATTLSITVTNEQGPGGLFFTPFLTAFHDGSYDTFNPGEAVRPEVEQIAEEGIVADEIGFINGLNGGAGFTTGVVTGPDGFGSGEGQPPVLDPGESSTITLDVDEMSEVFFSFASMVIPSNDFFLSAPDPEAFRIFDDAGNFVLDGPISVVADQVWDAGTEVNDGNGAAFRGADPSDEVLVEDPEPSTDENGVAVLANTLDDAGLPSLQDFFTAAGTQVTDIPSGSDALVTISIAEVAPIPLPAGLPLLAAGLGALALLRRRR